MHDVERRVQSHAPHTSTWSHAHEHRGYAGTTTARPRFPQVHRNVDRLGQLRALRFAELDSVLRRVSDKGGTTSDIS